MAGEYRWLSCAGVLKSTVDAGPGAAEGRGWCQERGQGECTPRQDLATRGSLGAQEGDRMNTGAESFGHGELVGPEVEERTPAKGRDSLSLVQAGSGAAEGVAGWVWA